MIKIGINGFGRIGRCIFRALIQSGRKDIVLKAVNVGIGDVDSYVHLLKYDSTHGIFKDFELIKEDLIVAGGNETKFITQLDPHKIDWQTLDVDIVLECSGAFTSYEKASLHLKSGAKKVIVSAPCEGADATVVFGVNEHIISPDHQIISVGSCTTNCLAPMAEVLNNKLGIVSGLITTTHAYTNDQMVLDGAHKDKRRARSCGNSIIPTSTGAAKSIGLVIPELAGKLNGAALRVPVINVSMLELNFVSSRPTTIDEINSLIFQAAKSSSVLSYCAEQLVSVDFNHNPSSCIFDSTQTMVVGGNFCRVAGWYDNEWGFSNRMLDVSTVVAEKL
jgi:glyceraldehyde 3-phosphate dehydrogenase